jgi:type IV secretory pathway component VirB8
MFVKLKDTIDLREFFTISFGSDNSTYYSYSEYFSLENLRKPTSAKIVDNRLSIDIIQADGEIFTVEYDNEDKDIWEILK